MDFVKNKPRTFSGLLRMNPRRRDPYSEKVRGKKVLVMGLGLLGGGVATTKWLIKHGAKVTVTDLKTKKELKSSIDEINKFVKKTRPVRGRAPQGGRSRSAKGGRAASNGVNFVLGKHQTSDFKQSDIIVVNPGVPKESKFLKIAKENNVLIENEASLFFRFCKNPIIGVTGTRGKTTTVNWIYHFLKQSASWRTRAVLTGNSSDNPMLKVLDGLDGKSPVVVELSSWQLEFLPKSRSAPHIAVITNIYRDHMNRYKNMREYILAKANIFSAQGGSASGGKFQNKNDFLILNKNNSWTKFFLALKPKSKILYFPSKRIKNNEFGIKNFKDYYGEHNYENLSAAILAVELAGVPRKVIKNSIWSLPQVKFRQEEIMNNKKFRIINDSTATSPDATIAALKRFGKGKGEVILIAGGTDKELEFNPPAGGWARVVKKYVRPENLYLLNGSATRKMIKELQEIGYFKNSKPQLFENLSILLKAIKTKLPTTNYQLLTTILFSPGAASFEKFKNEFDRGEKFNLLIDFNF